MPPHTSGASPHEDSQLREVKEQSSRRYQDSRHKQEYSKKSGKEDAEDEREDEEYVQLSSLTYNP